MNPENGDALTPAFTHGLAELAACMERNGLNGLHILDAGISWLLTELLCDEGEDGVIRLNKEEYRACLEVARRAMSYLTDQLIDDEQRLLCLGFLVKAVTNALLKEGKACAS